MDEEVAEGEGEDGRTRGYGRQQFMMSFYCPSPSSFFCHFFPRPPFHPLPPFAGVHTHTNSPGLSISADDAWRRQRTARSRRPCRRVHVYTYIRMHQTRAMDAAAWKARWGVTVWTDTRTRMRTTIFCPSPSLSISFVATRVATTRCTYRHHYDNVTQSYSVFLFQLQCHSKSTDALLYTS